MSYLIFASRSLPMSQNQGVLLSVLIVVLVITTTIINGLIIQAKIENIYEKLVDISQQLLVQSGYLKEKKNE